MSDYEESDIMSFKTMAEHFTKKNKILQNKQEDEDLDRKYFKYNEKRIHSKYENTFQDFYGRLFKKNKIVKLTGPNKLYEYRTLNYLRTKKNLKKKEIRTWDWMTDDDQVVKKKTHSENVQQHIREYREKRKKDLEERKKDLQKKSVISEEKKDLGEKM